ncbi:40s ribosomal protein s10 [Lichtheimia corymbifera JMRC:FSU:9682]|uniref:40s ribosomal protein s10 n=1 Tax=Lichtheimia corymbifera JMRC:FSU:9682 TaxID=1263082 RepID=A0A068RY71_9FUNG|nr:40s ribosomal protein s10 [Lichtheimia corymbifera JMRC:FSU:9682]
MIHVDIGQEKPGSVRGSKFPTIAYCELPLPSAHRDNMLIQKQNRKLIYETLFKDGALVAPKDFNLAKHPEIDVPNLETQFSWQWYYYTLTNEGIDYLREYLHLPQEIVPATLKKTARPAAPRRAFGGEGREGGRRDRDDYRRKEGASGDFKPEFRGGFGRGRRE